jgi:hypothetical protein
MKPQELSIWGPGKKYSLVAIDLVGPDISRGGVIGCEPGGITLYRGTDASHTEEFARIGFHLDAGNILVVLSVESAATLGAALVALAKNPEGAEN